MQPETIGIPPDQGERDRIMFDLDVNMMVVAGAGAGKTHALIERMVSVIRVGRDTVDHMAAITFTRKAAGEMKQRFHRRLAEAAAEAEGPERARLELARASVDRCFIGTIHAFCSRLIRSRPIEAGVPIDFREVDEQEEPGLQRRAWDAFVVDRIAEDDQTLLALEGHGVEVEDLFDFFRRRVQFAELPLHWKRVDKPDLGPAAVAGEAFVRRILPLIPEDKSNGPDDCMRTVEYASAFIDYHGVQTDADRARLLEILTRKKRVVLKRWTLPTSQTKEIRDHEAPAIDAVANEALTAWRAFLYAFVAEFVDNAQTFYGDLRLREGLLTFHDLLMRTVFLLKERPQVRKYLSRAYSTLFVDEFQDTDPLQAEILFLLTADDPLETVWQRAVPRPGSLFIVGDAKQSIYRFRRADVQVFELSRKKLEQTGAATARLQTSFRTLGALIDWINPAFETLFPAETTVAQSGYDELLKIRPQGADPLCVRKIQVQNTRRRPKRAAEQDSERIAAFIGAALAGRSEMNGPDGEAVLGERADPGDFMILTRNTTRLHLYARALERRGIPFDLVGGGRLGESRELRALVLVLEAVRDPANSVATVGYLRGPFVGLSDDDLLEMREGGLLFNYLTDNTGVLAEPLAGHVSTAYASLRSAERELFNRTPAAAFNRLQSMFGLVEFAASDTSGSASSRAGCLLRATSLVRKWESRGRNWVEILQDLRNLIDDKGSKIQEMTLEAGRDNVVQVMNLHQAKGLEARVVFLADPLDTGGRGRDPVFHVVRDDVDGDSVVIPAGKEKQFNSEPIAVPAGWDLHMAAEKEMLVAEELRLTYVAATRARDLLVVSTHHSQAMGPWHHVFETLKDVPELEVPEEVQPAVPPNLPVDVDGQIADIEQKWTFSRTASYAVRPVTGELEEDVLRLDATGRGPDYGAAVHRLLEELIEGRLGDRTRSYCAALFERLGVDPAMIDPAVLAVEGFRASTLWSALEEAPRKFTEVSLAVPEGSELPTVTRGRIDLVYEGPDGWHIVDYKTDEVAGEADVETIIRRYGDQVRAYARYWRRSTGEPVAKAGLWLTSLNRYEEISDI